MKKQQNLLRRTLIYSLLIIAITLPGYFGQIPLISDYLHDIENKTYDLLFIARHKFKLSPKPPKNIVIVGIDSQSIDKVGVSWPWPRQFHANLLDALSQAGAKFVVYDIVFDTISPLSLQSQDIQGDETVGSTSFDAGTEDDNIFANSILNAMNVFLACEGEPISNTEYHAALPIPPFLMALNNNISFLGNASVKYDNDNFIRRAKIIYPEFYKDPALTSSTALRVIQKHLKVKARVNPDYSVVFGNIRVPQEFLVNYYGPAQTIKTISYWKALDLLYGGKGSFFKNKIVYIGRTNLKASIDPFKSVRSPDSFPMPFASISPNYSGVELQATIAGNLMERLFIVEMNKILLLLTLIGIAAVSCFIVYKFRQRLGLSLLLSLSFCIAYLLYAFILFTFLEISIPPTFGTYGVIIPIYLVNFMDQYFVVDRARRRQAKIFRQLVPSQIADEIESMGEEQLALGGTKREITVLFTDIENFTKLCEKSAPETIVNILNQFFTEMVKVIHKHNGLVDKFIGDAIMAIWGSPKTLDKKLQAEFIANCALEMKRELKKLNQKWNENNIDTNLGIRMGINTDEAITGNIGSLDRIQFSAIGDGVNLAARLEAANKVYGTGILMSSNTAKLLDNGFLLREVDTVLVPGKDIPIDIYELVDPEEKSPELIQKYIDGLKNYRGKDFAEAIKLWEECLKMYPEDMPSQTMIKRTLKLQELQSNFQLPDDWKPIWNVETK